MGTSWSRSVWCCPRSSRSQGARFDDSCFVPDAVEVYASRRTVHTSLIKLPRTHGYASLGMSRSALTRIQQYRMLSQYLFRLSSRTTHIFSSPLVALSPNFTLPYRPLTGSFPLYHSYIGTPNIHRVLPRHLSTRRSTCL
jgi:hypothetical protein